MKQEKKLVFHGKNNPTLDILNKNTPFHQQIDLGLSRDHTGKKTPSNSVRLSL